MTCAEAYEAILEADPGELIGAGNDPLAVHFSGCPRCREMARAVLEEEAGLGELLGEVVPPTNLEKILERGTRERLRRRAAWVSIIPIAAAATVAGIFLAPDPQLPGPLFAPIQASPGLDVQAPEGQNVAVLKTNDPDITVLWLF